MDLRNRAVARVMAGEPVRSVAAVLEVSVASVVKWSQRFRRTGSAAPGPMHGHRPRVLLPHRAWIVARTANGQAFTLRGLQAELADRGVKVDYRTVWNFIHDEGLSFKKKRAGMRTGSSRHRSKARVLEEASAPG
ncbi:MAG: hypothetical protein POG24_05180 [Acidocella sp.]|nr:hypothetical protein [Acidocella sp.]